MDIIYRTDIVPLPEQVIDLYNSSGLPRPTTDKERIKKMFDNASLVVSAWENDLLVGVTRSITDWVWCCYLADLAVRQGYKQEGIGKKLLALTKETVGEQSMVLLLSVPEAMDYYPKMGFVKQDNSFLIAREK